MDNILRIYCRFIIKNPLRVLFGAMLLTIISAIWLLICKPLKLDTNFTTLLPSDIPCVMEAKRISRLMGSTDYLIVAVQSTVPTDNKAFIEEISTKIRNLPEVTWAAITEDKSFFRKRLALYLSINDLQEILRRAKMRVIWEKGQFNPFYIDLESDGPPDISMEDILAKYKKFTGEHGLQHTFPQATTNDNDSEGVKTKDYFANENGTIYSLVARTTKPSTDLKFGRELVKKVNAIILESSPHRNEDMTAEVVGSFRNRSREFDSIMDDIFSSLAVSFILILCLIVIYFRRIRAILLVTIPLLAGITWTISLTALTLGRLNMVTALIFAVLLGLGIDFGVHMSMRYLEERGRGKNLEESLFRAVGRTGRAILTSGVTTAGALAILIFSRFKGFSEFGIIATMGILLCLISYLTILPAIAVAMERITIPGNWRLRNTSFDKKIWPSTVSRGKTMLLLAVILVISGISIWSFPQLSFEYNFRNLKGANISTHIHYGKSIGGGTSPVVALLPTPEQARQLTRDMNKIVTKKTDCPVPLRRIFSLFSFIPDHQEEKIILLKKLRDYIDEALKLKNLGAKTRQKLIRIRNWTRVTPFTVNDLPAWVLTKFREKDGTLGRMVYLDSGLDDYRVDQISRFYDYYGTIKMADGTTVHPSSTGFILVEVIRAVQNDGVNMAIAAIVTVFLILLIDLRSITKAIFVFLPLCIGLTWTAGIMAAYGIKIGLYNMLVLPTLLGVGIDASIHLFHAHEEKGADNLFTMLRMTGGAVVVASLTTGAGFVGLLVVSHLGLRSIGILAIIGVLTCLAGTLLTMPTMFMLKEAYHNKKGKFGT